MTVSVICPTLNEGRFIGRTVQSFLDQKLNGLDLEVLVVDGMSTDATREIVKGFDQSRVRLIDNVDKRTPFAFNKGLKEAKGEYVAILGAHCEYAPQYIQTCYDELQKSGAVACTGRIISKAANDSIQAHMVEWILDSKFGVSGSSFRTIGEGYTHSVNFAVFRKDILLDLGGYNTKLFRNQDNDMNQRLLDAGHKLFCTWKTHCFYFPQSTLKKLFSYAYNNGFWNANSLRSNRRSMRVYHFVPFLFLMSLIFLGLGTVSEGLLRGTYWLTFALLGVLSMYFLAAIYFTVQSMVKDLRLPKLFLPFAFFAFHLSYGWGTLNGLLTMVWKRSVD